MNSNPNIEDDASHAALDPEIEDDGGVSLSASRSNLYSQDDRLSEADEQDFTEQHLESQLQNSRNEYVDEDDLVSKDDGPFRVNVEQQPESDRSMSPADIDVAAYSAVFFKLVNKRREAAGARPNFDNLGLGKLASEYAELIKEGNSVETIGRLMSKYDYRGRYEKILVSYEVAYETEFTNKQLDGWLADCLNLLFELEEDHDKLFDEALNSMGVGLAIDERYIYLSVFVGYVPIQIESMRINALNKLEIIGKVLEDDKGLYAIKLINVADPSVSELVTFQNIIFDLDTLGFVIETDAVTDIYSPQRVIEFYLKTDPESIKYGYKTKIKYLSKAYEVNMKVPLEQFPVQTSVNSALVTKSLNNSHNFDPVKKANDVRHSFSMQQSELGRSHEELHSDDDDELKPISHVDNSHFYPADAVEEIRRQTSRVHNEAAENSISEFYFENNSLDERKDIDLYNDANLRVELETAIHQALQELKKQISINRKLQSKLAAKWELTGIKIYSTEDNNNDGINEIKYHNALALIHQIRKELETVKNKYDKAADELNTKLEEKVANCDKIRKAFHDLKQEISNKASYETTMKKIPQKALDELEAEETSVNNTYQQLRLDVIKTRIAIDKNQRGIREQEQLAEGLHLIDFEKLKIENQSLNEKLEERNEEIFKLQKKNSVNVQILSHLKQKLGFEMREARELIDAYTEKSELSRQAVPQAEAEAARAGEGAEPGEAEDVAAESGDRDREEQVPEERLHLAQEEHRRAARRQGDAGGGLTRRSWRRCTRSSRGWRR